MCSDGGDGGNENYPYGDDNGNMLVGVVIYSGLNKGNMVMKRVRLMVKVMLVSGCKAGGDNECGESGCDGEINGAGERSGVGDRDGVGGSDSGL